MTEIDWLLSTDLQAMLGVFSDRPKNLSRPSDRKLRLFVCACCRQVWDWFRDERSRIAVEAAERFADSGDDGELVNARSAALAVTPGAWSDGSAAPAAVWASHEVAWEAAWGIGYGMPAGYGLTVPLREIIGNPFRPVTPCGLERRPFHDQFAHVDSNGSFWLEAECPVCSGLRTPGAVSLANAAYDVRARDGALDPVRLAVLADYLTEAGWDDSITAALRAPGPHYRGFWALDLVLGKW